MGRILHHRKQVQLNNYIQFPRRIKTAEGIDFQQYIGSATKPRRLARAKNLKNSIDFRKDFHIFNNFVKFLLKF